MAPWLVIPMLPPIPSDHPPTDPSSVLWQVTLVPTESTIDYAAITRHELIAPHTVGGLSGGVRHALMVQLFDHEIYYEAHSTVCPSVSRGAGVRVGELNARCCAPLG